MAKMRFIPLQNTIYDSCTRTDTKESDSLMRKLQDDYYKQIRIMSDYEAGLVNSPIYRVEKASE